MATCCSSEGKFLVCTLVFFLTGFYLLTGVTSQGQHQGEQLSLSAGEGATDGHEEGSTNSAGRFLHASGRWRIRRESCLCNQKGTFYGLCNPLPAYGNKCLCKRGFAGNHCDTCSSASYGYPNCKSCNCNVFGALASKCHNATGQCSCKEKIQGRACDSCISGFFRFPICQECSCPKNRTTNDTCDNRTGACFCRSQYDGDNCEQCKLGYFGFPQCNACRCTSFGANTTTCDRKTGQCKCKVGFSGMTCDRCTNINQKVPDCSADMKEGAAEKTTPRNTTGGDSAINKGKVSKDGKDDMFCEGELTCQPVGHKKFSSCADLFYNDTESRFSTCVPCGCFGEGTLSSILSCDQSNGKCFCKNHVQGQTCDRCMKGYHDAKNWNIFGCSSCQCNHGGSISKNCDDDGKCKCRENTGGQKCDRVREGNHFLPDLYHIKFELEDGKMDDGSQAAYGYSHAIFPDFTWKGYVTFADDQERISLKIQIDKSSRYKVLVKYILLAKQDGSAALTISQISSEGEHQYQGRITFKTAASRSSYATSNSLASIYLEAGDWLLDIASKSRGLYLDHVSLLPESYYNTRELLIATPHPCHVGIRWYESCALHEYIAVSRASGYLFPGYSGHVLKGSVLKPAQSYDDPDMLRILKLGEMGMMSPRQDTIIFNTSVDSMGKYNIILEYFNADEKVYRVNVRQGGRTNYENHVMLSKCPYTFLCRAAVLRESNAPSVFDLKRSSSIILNGRIEGMIGIHRVIAIPVKTFTSEYLEPHFKSIIRDGHAMESARLPVVNQGINMIKRNESFAMYTAFVPASTWWALIITYNQPKYPTFQVEVVYRIADETSKRYIDIKHCPSTIGCRSSVSNYLARGTLQVIVRRPKRRDFIIKSISIQRDGLYGDSTTNPTHLDMSMEYKATCIDKKNLPISNPLSQFCRTASFTQISEFNGGAHSCSCHPHGSVSSQCESIGGQCKCRRNIIGRRCHTCRAGFYNFPYCRNCRCFMTGSVGPECNRNGECKCRPRYGGRKCNKCISSLFYDFPYCKPCACNHDGALGQFCSSRTGQCQCLRNFRGRQCDMCQVGFYDFPRCVPCTCHAAGTNTNENGSSGCFPGEKNQCSCKENVEGMLCDRCKDLFFNLHLANPKGCIPCKCDRSGTLNGIATCDRNSGQCYCKRNVDARSRTCDVCKDGFYGLDKSDVFGCKPCECNPGGSTSRICEKKTGKCTCKPNITGRKCDRLSSRALYMPTIRHLQYPAGDGVSASGKSVLTEEDSGYVALAQFNEPIQWKVTLPKKSLYIFIMNYKMKGNQTAEITISIRHPVYKSTFYEMKSVIKRPSEVKLDTGAELFVLRKNSEDFPLDLYGGTYIVQLSTSASDLLLDFISLIPLNYLTGDTLISKAEKPCTVYRSREHCVRYSYVTIPRKGIYSLELEGTGRKEAEVLDQSKYPMLSINGAIVLRRNQPYSISFKQQTSGDFIFLIQYFKPEKLPIDVSVTIYGYPWRTIGTASLSNCPDIFGCRQVMLNQAGVVTRVSLQKGVTYNVSFSTKDAGSAALDLLFLVPKTLWSVEFITPTPLCVALGNKCIETGFLFPEGHVALPVSKSISYVKPTSMPLNIQDRNLRPILIDKKTNVIRWTTPLQRGYFNVIVHYFQPNHPSTVVKIIINTQFSSIAGNIHLSYCPHIDGCRALVLSEDSSFHRVEGIYVTGDQIQATFVTLPDGFQAWINYMLLVRPGLFYDTSSVLTERQVSLSHIYKTECIKNYSLQPDLSRSCFDWLFQLIMAFNDGPDQCNCKIRGSIKASCKLIGGQCPCKKHVIGRTCSRCVGGRLLYPRCILGNNLKGILVSK